MFRFSCKYQYGIQFNAILKHTGRAPWLKMVTYFKLFNFVLLRNTPSKPKTSIPELSCKLAWAPNAKIEISMRDKYKKMTLLPPNEHCIYNTVYQILSLTEVKTSHRAMENKLHFPSELHRIMNTVHNPASPVAYHRIS